jgi:hypothetical protein
MEVLMELAVRMAGCVVNKNKQCEHNEGDEAIEQMDKIEIAYNMWGG